MKKKWTRRKFLESSLTGSIAMGGTIAGFAATTARSPAQKGAFASAGLSPHQRELLRAAMDEIIPAGDKMPAASEVEGVGYLERLGRQNRAIKLDLEKSLARLESVSRKQFGISFASLARPERVEALKKLEKEPPREIFVHLRDAVYEAYYTSPKVWKLIGYEFYPTNQAGPLMKPFDDSALAQVRRKPKFYREAE